MKAYLKLLRPEHWVKNSFVFLPLFFSGNMLNPELVPRSVFAFVLFCLAVSAIYVLNDYCDIEADRQHPIKKLRPLASGAVSRTSAQLIFAGLMAAAAVFAFAGQRFFSSNFVKLFIVTGAYFTLNLAYTFKLKHVAIVDICIIASGFVMRVLAGGYATGIEISQWAILLTFVLALVLAIGKRRGELVNASRTGKTRRALDGYNVQFADIALSISVTLAIVCYLMFTLSPQIQLKFGAKVFYTVLFVVFALLRYLQQTLVYNRTESPTRTIYRDRYIQLTLLLWLSSFAVLIYLK